MREQNTIHDFIKLKQKKGCKDKNIYNENNEKIKFTNKLKDYQKNNFESIKLHYVIETNDSNTLDNTKDIQYGYIYIIQPREFIKTNETIYKIGKTTRNILQRYSEYPKQSNLIYCCPVDNNTLNTIENGLIKLFDEKFNKCNEIGCEYYDGELSQMIFVINNYINSHIY